MWKSPSRISWLVSSLILICMVLSQAKWHQNKVPIMSDVSGHYTYLPTLFIYQDLHFQYVDSLNEQYNKNVYWHQTDSEGLHYAKCFIGMSVLYSPFFLLAHSYATLTDHPADGYSTPYQMAIQCSGTFFAIVGLYFLMLLINSLYSERITAFVIPTILFSTNLLYYSFHESALTHSASFMLITSFLFFSLSWLKKPNFKSAVFTALSLALIILVRPTNIIIALVPILIGSFDTNISKNINYSINILWKYRSQTFIMVITGLLVVLPQLLYWKMATGNWFYYSYGEESFFFLSPHILDGLFSYRKGWLLYTPIMMVSLIGLFFIKGKSKALRLPIIIFITLNIYITFSWWCWWYGGSFGARTMVDSYGLLAIPLAAFYNEMSRRKLLARSLFVALIVFLTSLNLFQTHQKITNVLHYDAMTKSSYWLIFGKTELEPEYWDLLKFPDYDRVRKGLPELLNEKIVSSTEIIEQRYDTKNKKGAMINIKNKGGPKIVIPGQLLIDNSQFNKIRASIEYNRAHGNEKVAFVMEYRRGKDNLDYKYRKLKARKDGKAVVKMDMKIPKDLRIEDTLFVYSFSEASVKVWIKEMNISLLEVSKY